MVEQREFGTMVNILTSDRSFVKLEDDKEIDVDPHTLNTGDVIRIYTDSAKETLCHWGEFTSFKYLESFTNEEDVEFVTCELVD